MRGGIETVQRDAKKVDGEEVERWRSNGRAMVEVKEKVNTDVRGGRWTRHKGEARTEVVGGKWRGWYRTEGKGGGRLYQEKGVEEGLKEGVLGKGCW